MDKLRERNKKMLAMHRAGKTIGEIAEEVGLSYATVSDRIREEDSIDTRARATGGMYGKVISVISIRTYYALMRAGVYTSEALDEILQGKQKRPRLIGEHAIKEIRDAIKEE